ncbi:MAG TPA: bifunctional hydroxymethylpyrimidine kinase/phosphomethylpyrimidine kinase [Gammaproteobacteria bacterium]|nr:bifunctional hydroxymethylpyrimidine kinase/phosphomethylpyrimidine kinase [Gammaproteobacteria bacterium]
MRAATDRQEAPPVVLVIAGNDPSGGAGLQADIQTITALGAHPAPVVTCLTVQDTRNASQVSPVEPDLVTAQARAVLDDLPVAAVKIGLLGTAAIGHAVAALLADLDDVAVVLDPVLVAAGGAALAEDALIDVLLAECLPHVTVLTPNAHEIRRLAPAADDPAGRARLLIEAGCRYVLVKGGDEAGEEVHNLLYDAGGEVEHFTWMRLPHAYHGSGCTLASAIAALLAHGKSPRAAVAGAQRFTFEALRHAFRPGGGQYVPRRIAGVGSEHG